ncbi:MAG: hypothetical protein JJT95_17730 [Pararhodobacter sp.]|nr:hypothetical protein [Pararhodobacter sp.]
MSMLGNVSGAVSALRAVLIGAPLLALALLQAPADLLVPAAHAQTAGSGAASSPEASRYRIVNVADDDVLNVRAGPGAENMIVGVLAPNATGIHPTGEVAQAGDGGTWWQIADSALPGGSGWINARFLRPDMAHAEPAAAAQDVRDAPANLTGYRDRVGEVIRFRVTGAPTGAIWGTDIYSDDSRVARAAVHAGMLDVGETAVLEIELLPGQAQYEPSERHGVRSRRWSRQWHGSFRFVGVAADVAQPGQQVAQAADPAISSAQGPFLVTGIDANAVLYLRAEPSSGAAIVGILAPDADGIEGTGQTTQAEGADWIELVAPAAPGGRGWVMAANLQPAGSAASAPAIAAPADDGPTLTGMVEEFAQVPGYREIDTQDLENAIWPILPNAPDTAMAPGSALAPLVKAVLAVQAHDGALPSARYHLRYAQADVTTQPGRPTERLSLIELRRFNLGPARHRQLQDIHGPDNVAPLAEFGEGPHVGWRIVTRGLRGTQASILAASRREIDTPERDCLGFHCLMLQGINEHLIDWEMQPAQPAPDFSPSYEPVFRGGPSTAAALDMLALHNRLAQVDGHGDARWNQFELRESVAPGEAFVDVIVETGLWQDAGADVVLRDSELMDTSLETMWYRLVILGTGQGAQIVPGQAAEHRPGHQ